MVISSTMLVSESIIQDSAAVCILHTLKRIRFVVLELYSVFVFAWKLGKRQSDARSKCMNWQLICFSSHYHHGSSLTLLLRYNSPELPFSAIEVPTGCFVFGIGNSKTNRSFTGDLPKVSALKVG